MGQAVNGPLKDEHLVSVPIEHTTWADCGNSIRRQKFSPVTPGFIHDYGRSPYSDYDKNGDIYFTLSFRSCQYHPKECVIGIENNGNFKAYPFVELSQKKVPIERRAGGPANYSGI